MGVTLFFDVDMIISNYRSSEFMIFSERGIMHIALLVDDDK